MEQDLVVYIGIYKALGIIATVIGGVAWGAWYAASRLTRVETKVDGFENRLTNLEGRLDSAFASKSHINLLPKGQSILDDSGLKKYIDEKTNEFLEQCKSKHAMDNPYDIQEASFKFFDQLEFGDFEVLLKKSAFSHGVSMDTVRRIGGIYFRDICLANSGFKPEDIDKHKQA